MSAMVRLLSGTTSGRNIEVPVSNIKILEPIKVRVVLRTLKVKESSDSYFIDPMRPTTFGRSFFVSVNQVQQLDTTYIAGMATNPPLSYESAR